MENKNIKFELVYAHDSAHGGREKRAPKDNKYHCFLCGKLPPKGYNFCNKCWFEEQYISNNQWQAKNSANRKFGDLSYGSSYKQFKYFFVEPDVQQMGYLFITKHEEPKVEKEENPNGKVATKVDKAKDKKREFTINKNNNKRERNQESKKDLNDKKEQQSMINIKVLDFSNLSPEMKKMQEAINVQIKLFASMMAKATGAELGGEFLENKDNEEDKKKEKKRQKNRERKLRHKQKKAEAMEREKQEKQDKEEVNDKKEEEKRDKEKIPQASAKEVKQVGNKKDQNNNNNNNNNPNGEGKQVQDNKKVDIDPQRQNKFLGNQAKPEDLQRMEKKKIRNKKAKERKKARRRRFIEGKDGWQKVESKSVAKPEPVRNNSKGAVARVNSWNKDNTKWAVTTRNKIWFGEYLDLRGCSGYTYGKFLTLDEFVQWYGEIYRGDIIYKCCLIITQTWAHKWVTHDELLRTKNKMDKYFPKDGWKLKVDKNQDKARKKFLEDLYFYNPGDSYYPGLSNDAYYQIKNKAKDEKSKNIRKTLGLKESVMIHNMSHPFYNNIKLYDEHITEVDDKLGPMYKYLPVKEEEIRQKRPDLFKVEPKKIAILGKISKAEVNNVWKFFSRKLTSRVRVPKRALLDIIKINKERKEVAKKANLLTYNGRVKSDRVTDFIRVVRTDDAFDYINDEQMLAVAIYIYSGPSKDANSLIGNKELIRETVFRVAKHLYNITPPNTNSIIEDVHNGDLNNKKKKLIKEEDEIQEEEEEQGDSEDELPIVPKLVIGGHWTNSTQTTAHMADYSIKLNLAKWTKERYYSKLLIGWAVKRYDYNWNKQSRLIVVPEFKFRLSMVFLDPKPIRSKFPVKSLFIFKGIIKHLSQKGQMRLVRYNKQLQDYLNYNLNSYMVMSPWSKTSEGWPKTYINDRKSILSERSYNLYRWCKMLPCPQDGFNYVPNPNSMPLKEFFRPDVLDLDYDDRCEELDLVSELPNPMELRVKGLVSDLDLANALNTSQNILFSNWPLGPKGERVYIAPYKREKPQRMILPRFRFQAPKTILINHKIKDSHFCVSRSVQRHIINGNPEKVWLTTDNRDLQEFVDTIDEIRQKSNRIVSHFRDIKYELLARSYDETNYGKRLGKHYLTLKLQDYSFSMKGYGSGATAQFKISEVAYFQELASKVPKAYNPKTAKIKSLIVNEPCLTYDESPPLSGDSELNLGRIEDSFFNMNSDSDEEEISKKEKKEKKGKMKEKVVKDNFKYSYERDGKNSSDEDSSSGSKGINKKGKPPSQSNRSKQAKEIDVNFKYEVEPRSATIFSRAAKKKVRHCKRNNNNNNN